MPGDRAGDGAEGVVEEGRVEVLRAADGERVAVREGLKPGERVVLEGLDRLREGSKVEVVTEATGKDSAEPEA